MSSCLLIQIPRNTVSPMGICFYLYPEEKSLCLWLEGRLKLGVMGNYATSEVLPKI